MGAKMSTVEETTTSNFASATAAPATLPPLYAPTFSPSYNKAAVTAYDYYSLPENRAQTLPTGHKKARTNTRIMAFHSTAGWKGYVEASKAFPNLIVVDFMTAWYGPCRYMEPIINEFAAKYPNVEFVKIDVDDLPAVSRQYGVQTTPTFVLIKKGKMVDKVVGVRKEELQRKIEIHKV